jgi:uncharacterized protein (DUF1499 family)
LINHPKVNPVDIQKQNRIVDAETQHFVDCNTTLSLANKLRVRACWSGSGAMRVQASVRQPFRAVCLVLFCSLPNAAHAYIARSLLSMKSTTSSSSLSLAATSSTSPAEAGIMSRQHVLRVLGTLTSAFVLTDVSNNDSSSAFAAEEAVKITPCVKSGSGSPPNCVSTASVKQIYLYMPPWTWNEVTSVDEVAARLKGAIAADPTLTLEEQREDRYFRVRAVRNFCYDQIEFVLNPVDRVVAFRSQQIEGPDSVSDFGGNRRRLDEIRRRASVLGVMGEEFDSADSSPREGAADQLKAFWGLQSGGGYQSILLDEDE